MDRGSAARQPGRGDPGPCSTAGRGDPGDPGARGTRPARRVGSRRAGRHGTPRGAGGRGALEPDSNPALRILPASRPQPPRVGNGQRRLPGRRDAPLGVACAKRRDLLLPGLALTTSPQVPAPGEAAQPLPAQAAGIIFVGGQAGAQGSVLQGRLPTAFCVGGAGACWWQQGLQAGELAPRRVLGSVWGAVPRGAVGPGRLWR